MDLLEERRNAAVTVFFLFGILLVLTAADLIGGERLFSEAENRILAQKPVWNTGQVLAGEYAQAYEEYAADQFVGREKWVSLKSLMDLAQQKKEIGGVYLGRGGYLIEQHLPRNYPARLEDQKLALLELLTERYPQTLVMLVPTADNVLEKRMPAFAPYYDQEAFLERVRNLVGEKRYVDVLGILREHAGEEIYYRTDHHWTTLGALYAYQELMGHTGGRAGRYDPGELAAVSESFRGTLYSRLPVFDRQDEIRILPGTQAYPVEITYDFGKKAQSCYEDKYLSAKNQYGYFLDDSHSFVEIDTGYHTGKTLFVIKDSYANTLIPLLVPEYSRIYVLDPRYFFGELFEFMDHYQERSGEMDVLVLYNCIHFLEDFRYYPQIYELTGEGAGAQARAEGGNP